MIPYYINLKINLWESRNLLIIFDKNQHCVSSLNGRWQDITSWTDVHVQIRFRIVETNRVNHIISKLYRKFIFVTQLFPHMFNFFHPILTVTQNIAYSIQNTRLDKITKVSPSLGRWF